MAITRSDQRVRQRASSTTTRRPQSNKNRTRGKSGEDVFGGDFKHRLFNLGVGMDLPLLIIVLSLVGIGLVVLFSASFAQAYYYDGNSYAYINKQFGFAIGGIVIMLVASVVDYHVFFRISKLLFGIALILLLIVLLIPSLSASKGDATRWISLGDLSFQPSEVAKFTLVVMLSSIIASAGNKLDRFTGATFKCFVAMFTVAGLVFLENHVSGTIIILAVSFFIMFVGGVRLRYFMILGSLAIPVLVYFIFFSDRFAYALLRIQGWIDPFNPPVGVDTYQTKQSIYAIGSGQIFGVGLGQSKQKYMYLPESKNDFIFPIAAEELGFVGAVFIILLFVALVWRGTVISMNAKDSFGMLLGIGMTLTVGLQAALNICVVTNAIPNTGISLPFFSYGGTSIIMLLGQMGVLLSVSRGSYMEKT